MSPPDDLFSVADRVEEILGPCLFLASPSASFVTGATLVVDGCTTSMSIHGEALAGAAE